MQVPVARCDEAGPQLALQAVLVRPDGQFAQIERLPACVRWAVLAPRKYQLQTRTTVHARPRAVGHEHATGRAGGAGWRGGHEHATARAGEAATNTRRRGPARRPRTGHIPRNTTSRGCDSPRGARLTPGMERNKALHFEYPANSSPWSAGGDSTVRFHATSFASRVPGRQRNHKWWYSATCWLPQCLTRHSYWYA
jgi:hypothetical protein